MKSASEEDYIENREKEEKTEWESERSSFSLFFSFIWLYIQYIFHFPSSTTEKSSPACTRGALHKEKADGWTNFFERVGGLKERENKRRRRREHLTSATTRWLWCNSLASQAECSNTYTTDWRHRCGETVYDSTGWERREIWDFIEWKARAFVRVCNIEEDEETTNDNVDIDV